MREGWLRAGLLAGVLVLAPVGATAATLLPNGMQTFVDANGVPISGGRVYFYIPNTLTPKGTWRDPGQLVPNSNPVVLDSAGRAVIYGSGSYREILKDQVGNLVWDKLTQGFGSSGQLINPTINGSVTIAACAGFFPIINGSSLPITVTLPVAPQDGDSCQFADLGNNASSYLITLSLGPNQFTLGGHAAYIGSSGGSLTLTWISGSSKWTPN